MDGCQFLRYGGVDLVGEEGAAVSWTCAAGRMWEAVDPARGPWEGAGGWSFKLQPCILEAANRVCAPRLRWGKLEISLFM